MSNANWQGNGGDSPWASQDPNWRPQQFDEHQGRDPRQPFGQPSAPQPGYGYEDLGPPKRPNRSLWIVLAAVVVIAGLILGMQFLGAPGTADPTPSAAATTTAAPSPTRTGNFIPFEGNGDGIFEIVSSTWTDEGLTVKVRVEVDHGEYGFSLFAFTNETRESFDPVGPPAFTVAAGTPYETDVTFLMPKADSTIVLATTSGRVALNALQVKGS
ncbi:MAG: hypothetical protein QM713_16645 [Arachnia sp.]